MSLASSKERLFLCLFCTLFVLQANMDKVSAQDDIQIVAHHNVLQQRSQEELVELNSVGPYVEGFNGLREEPSQQD